MKITDYKGARKIINGTDKAALIAGYAESFEQILRDSLINESAFAMTNSFAPAQEPEVINDANETPDGAQPGEAAPKDTAKEGEAIVGGRPGDPAKEVVAISVPQAPLNQIEVVVTKIKAWWAAVGTAITAFLATVYSKLTNMDPATLRVLVICLIVIGAVITAGILWIKNQREQRKAQAELEEKRIQEAREARAHEINKLQLQIASNPTLYNVQLKAAA